MMQGADPTVCEGELGWCAVDVCVDHPEVFEAFRQMDKLSKQMDEAAGGADPSKFSRIQSEFQAESQLFGMLQSAFSNALKSIGEGLKTMASK